MPQPPKRPKPGPWTSKDRGPAFAFWNTGGSPLAMWRDGVVLPLILAIVGLVPLVTGHFEAKGRGGTLVLDGAPARVLGLAVIAFGACWHVHSFWERHERLSWYSHRAMIVAGLVFLGSIGYLACSAFAR
jgi:hypothetical protein